MRGLFSRIQRGNILPQQHFLLIVQERIALSIEGRHLYLEKVIFCVTRHHSPGKKQNNGKEKPEVKLSAQLGRKNVHATGTKNQSPLTGLTRSTQVPFEKPLLCPRPGRYQY